MGMFCRCFLVFIDVFWGLEKVFCLVLGFIVVVGFEVVLLSFLGFVVCVEDLGIISDLILSCLF